MYTVARFRAQDLERLELALKEALPGASVDSLHAGDGFACDVADGGHWGHHHAAIVKFIRETVAVIEHALQQDVDVCIDVALESEDVARTPVLSVAIDLTMATLLSKSGVTLVLSVYRP